MAKTNVGSSMNMLMVITLVTITISSLIPSASAQLSVSFYANSCPSVFDTIRSATRAAINREPRMGSSILRLFFHDCFVNGCDAGVLLNDAGTFVGEQSAPANQALLRSLTIVNNIKAQVDRACGGISVVSCADILAVATRDSIVELGGPSYSVPVGRRDSRTASLNGANSDIPAFFHDLQTIINAFDKKGFSAREMVVLSGAHTVGQARCVTFRDRIYNQTNIDPAYAESRKATCPRQAGNGDDTLGPLDPQSPNRFGNNYFQALMERRGLLNSDQVLFNGGSTDSFVREYAANSRLFYTDFANAMVKMGNLGLLTGTQGEVRANCARVN